jgi:hypothetical protein
MVTSDAQHMKWRCFDNSLPAFPAETLTVKTIVIKFSGSVLLCQIFRVIYTYNLRIRWVYTLRFNRRSTTTWTQKEIPSCSLRFFLRETASCCPCRTLSYPARKTGSLSRLWDYPQKVLYCTVLVYTRGFGDLKLWVQKEKFALEHAMRALREYRGTALVFL